jgi:hypothetical protein
MRRLILPLVALSLLIGCKKRAASPPATPGAATSRPVILTTAPTTRPASILTIDNKAIAFPAAKLVLTSKSAGVQVILCSDDPPAAIDPTYAGNSYMLEMVLDIDDPAELPSATWVYQAPNAIPRNSATGIFLDGSRRQMQPLDVKVTFAKQGSNIVATVAGTFLSFDSRDVAAPTQIVNVTGKLDAAVSER